MFKQALLAASLLGLAAAAPHDVRGRHIEKRANFLGDLIKRDPEAKVKEPAAVFTINNNDGTGAGNGTAVKTPFSGDGTAGAGWPSMDQWVSFDAMFTANKPDMFVSCEYFQVPADTEAETQGIYNGIQTIAKNYGVDHRFILAVIMQESHGCVRVWSTDNGVHNPGLMQSHDGTGSCNDGGTVSTPCPDETIEQMIKDGAVGTAAGSGLATLINGAQSNGATDAQTFYVASRWYNSGDFSVPVGGDLSQAAGATASYASDVANRLAGWTG